MADLFRKVKSLYASTTNTFSTGTGVTITPNSVSGLPTDTEITLTFDRVNSQGVETPNAMERIIGTVVGSNFVVRTSPSTGRGADGTSDAAHTSPVVEYIPNAKDMNDATDGILVEHTQAGLHKETALDSMIAGTEAAGDIIYHNGTIWTRLPAGSNTNVLTLAAGVPSWAAASSGGASFWTDVPGTPTRVSDTQFTITDTSNANLYDLIFKRGVLLRWLESSTFQVAMVVSSSYGANTVTINLIGDSLTAGFTAMKYCLHMAQREQFIIAGTFPSAATTDLSRTLYLPEDQYIIGADLYVKTAGSGSGSTVVDINVSGSTKFTTKPTLTTTGTTDLDNVADTPSTACAKDAPVTVDVDSVTATTAPTDGYVYIYMMPVSWRYRS